MKEIFLSNTFLYLKVLSLKWGPQSSRMQTEIHCVTAHAEFDHQTSAYAGLSDK